MCTGFRNSGSSPVRAVTVSERVIVPALIPSTAYEYSTDGRNPSTGIWVTPRPTVNGVYRSRSSSAQYATRAESKSLVPTVTMLDKALYVFGVTKSFRPAASLGDSGEVRGEGPEGAGGVGRVHARANKLMLSSRRALVAAFIGEPLSLVPGRRVSSC